MGIFINPFSSKKITAGGLRNHPNAIKLAALSGDKAKKMSVELKQFTQQLTAKDLARWRSANQLAISRDNPKRYSLYDIYDDAMLDEHLIGAVRNRKMKILASPFKVVDKDGIQNHDLTMLLRSWWFRKFINLSLDSRFYGHSLIQFGDIIRQGKLRFDDVTLVPRRHVCPEYHVLLREISDDPAKGIDYTKPPYSLWSIPVCETPYSLGELNSVAKETISKRHVLQYWDQFAEMFGMPIRVAKTASRDKKDIDKLEAIMESMGSASYAVFPEGTEIEFIEADRGDAYKVYDMRVQRANTEISKAILGQTMTMDDGSSKSQAVVHENVSEEIAQDDMSFIYYVVNDQLIPFLNMHGFGFNEHLFEWDDTYEYTQDEIRQVETMLLTHYDIDPQYFIDRYDIAITGVKASAIQDPGEKKKVELIAQWPEIKLCCAEHDDMLQLARSQQSIDEASEAMIRFMWDNPGSDYSHDMFLYTSEALIDALVRGWSNRKKITLASSFGDIKIGYDSPDWGTIQMMEANLFRFSAAKAMGMANELNALLPESKTFEDFKKKAQPKLEQLNARYLRSEYNLAWSTSRNAAEYHRLVRIKESMPTWEYVTAGDDRVREAHRALDGKMFKADDPAFEAIYPPNGWGCRCYVRASTKQLPDSDYTTKEEAIKLLQQSSVDKNGVSEWDRMVKGRFNKNRAVARVIFDENRFYVKSELMDKLGVKSNGAIPFDEISQMDLPKAKIPEQGKNEALEFFAKLTTKPILDYNKRVIAFQEKTAKKHLDSKYIDDGIAGRQNTINLIPEILTKPDEVWLFKDSSSGRIMLRYIKYYDQGPVNVITEYAENTRILSWYDLDTNKLDNNLRNGILIKNNL